MMENIFGHKSRAIILLGIGFEMEVKNWKNVHFGLFSEKSKDYISGKQKQKKQ